MHTRADSEGEPTAPTWVLPAALFSALWFLVLYVLPPQAEYARFGLSNFDFGMVFQSSDLLSRGEPLFMSCRGVHAWADNQDYLQLVFAPFHWLADPHRWLLLAHSLGAFAPGLLCLAWLWRSDRRAALAAALLAWASPFMINMNMDLLHIETLATAVLLGLYFAAKRGSAPAFWAALVAALAAKEDVALTTGLWMLLFFLEARRFRLPRAHFAIGFALSVVVFFVNLKLVLPHYKVATCLWLDPSAAVEAMDSVPAALAYQDVLRNWYKPSFLIATFLDPRTLLYVALVVWPLLLFVRQPTLLWLGPAAGLFVNAVSESIHFVEGYYHYDYCTFAAVLVVVLEGLGARARSKARPGAALGLVAGALGLGLAFPTPRSVAEQGLRGMRTELYAPVLPTTYDLTPVDEVRWLEALDRVLPAEAVVSADERSLCYLLAGRSAVFQFKNPFETHFFGLYDQCTSFAEPPAVDLVVLRRELERRLDAIEGLLPAGFVRQDDARTPFLVWLGPEFGASDAGRAVAELIAGARPPQ